MLALLANTPTRDWFDIAQSFGLPVVMLFVVVWGLSKVAIWLGHRVVVPVMERHVKFIDKLEGSVEKQSDNLDRMATSQEALAEDLRTLVGKANEG